MMRWKHICSHTSKVLNSFSSTLSSLHISLEMPVLCHHHASISVFLQSSRTRPRKIHFKHLISVAIFLLNSMSSVHCCLVVGPNSSVFYRPIST